MKAKKRYSFLIMATVAFVAAWPLARGGSFVTAAPTFTGNVPADFTGSNVIKIDDPSFGIGLPDVGLPMADGQFPDDRISGWDMNAIYFEYDSVTDIMYVGIDCFEICGDADSDGDPGSTGPILESLVGLDNPDFGSTESIALLLDTDNDCDVDSSSAIDAVIGVPLGLDITALGAYTFVGSPLSPSTGFGTPLNNEVELFANPSANAPDLEFSISNFSTLPGFDTEPSTELSFQVNAFMGSLEDDGIGEDFLIALTECIPVTPPPTETPTETPTQTPTETPMSTSTDTPVPPPTDTPIPPSTDTPVPPPTDTPVPPPTDTPVPPPTDTPVPPPTDTPVPPPTDTPVPTPTATYTPPPPPTATYTPPPADTPLPPPNVPQPPPTMLPPTGPDALGLSRVLSADAMMQDRALVPYYGPSPLRIEIEAINVSSNVEPMSWYYVSDQSGNQVPQWNVVDYAVGWHINSAKIGEPGNVVMSGHNTIRGSVFQNLSSLKRGDRVSVWNDAQSEFTYVIDQVRIVPEEKIDVAQQQANAQWLTDFGDERLTLISCWPDYNSSSRIIVVAHRESQ